MRIQRLTLFHQYRVLHVVGEKITTAWDSSPVISVQGNVYNEEEAFISRKFNEKKYSYLYVCAHLFLKTHHIFYSLLYELYGRFLLIID